MDVKVVLDASVVLAMMLDEPGADTAVSLMSDAAISAVNVTEVVTRLVQMGENLEDVELQIETLKLAVIAYDEAIAKVAGQFSRLGRSHGVSLGDRACLATATFLGKPAATAENLWSKLELPCRIIPIR